MKGGWADAPQRQHAGVDEEAGPQRPLQPGGHGRPGPCLSNAGLGAWDEAHAAAEVFFFVGFGSETVLNFLTA